MLSKNDKNPYSYMKRKLVSIIVPAYNVEKYIQKSIWSLTHQTLSDIEIIIVDDGSTDNTKEICKEAAKDDERIKYIRKKNGGVSSARNEALKHCCGEYIGFVDADDCPCLDMFEIMYSSANKYESDCAICEFKRIDSSEPIDSYSSIYSVSKVSCNDAIKLVMDFDKSIQVSLWNKIFRKEVIEGIKFDTNKYVSEDMEFLIRGLVRCKKVVYINAPLYGYYSQRVGSAMYKKNHNLKWYYDQARFIDDTMDFLIEKKPELEHLAIGFKCGNGYMSMANHLAQNDIKDKKTISFIRSMLRHNWKHIFLSNLKVKKKLQMLIFLLNFRVYQRFITILKK